jgi:hypothetical protein
MALLATKLIFFERLKWTRAIPVARPLEITKTSTFSAFKDFSLYSLLHQSLEPP